ncbi:hypothetical protein QBC35DRAFT_491612 [Podospora australis]|uniref:Golgi to ER traffic protein 2 n=1 Tax=Podospora australis TaxID=1536484 RepID=A0AAN7AL07_9PEZI|nr:hypothetical protein QBC35DRAFT_491612 [Podospora australis]
MAELTPEEEAANARANEQARLRKAKREAKLKAGGDARLKKITGLGGRVPDITPEVTTTPPIPSPTPPTARQATVQHGDPDEVDISQHFYQPATTNRIPPSPPQEQISEQQLRQMMLGFDPTASGGPGTFPQPPNMGMGGMGSLFGIDGSAPSPGQEGEDPMMKMMMQMLGGASPGGPPGANPFASMMPGQQEVQQPQVARHASIFRILHTLLALSLGIYVALFSTWTGSKSEREIAAANWEKSSQLGFMTLPEEREVEIMKRNFLWVFATGEALLLTTRFFLDGKSGAAAGSARTGVIGALLGFVPQPLKGRIEMVLRYREIVNRVKGDVLVVLFVLGAVGWWRS